MKPVFSMILLHVFFLTYSHVAVAMQKESKHIFVINALNNSNEKTQLMSGDHITLEQLQEAEQKVPPMTLCQKVGYGVCSLGWGIVTLSSMAAGVAGSMELYENSVDSEGGLDTQERNNGIAIGSVTGFAIGVTGLIGWTLAHCGYQKYRHNQWQKKLNSETSA